jgi:hypothetical protein
MAELIVRSLYAGSYPAFESVDQIGDLIGDEMETLMAEVQPALRVISPTYGRADWRAWDAALKLGARHGSNSAEAILLGACYSEYAERPDWYFGGCLADLTDGQMMAYRAARSIVLQQRKNS